MSEHHSHHSHHSHHHHHHHRRSWWHKTKLYYYLQSLAPIDRFFAYVAIWAVILGIVVLLAPLLYHKTSTTVHQRVAKPTEAEWWLSQEDARQLLYSSESDTLLRMDSTRALPADSLQQMVRSVQH